RKAAAAVGSEGSERIVGGCSPGQRRWSPPAAPRSLTLAADGRRRTIVVFDAGRATAAIPSMRDGVHAWPAPANRPRRSRSGLRLSLAHVRTAADLWNA